MSGTTAKLGAIALFWIAVGLIQTFNWGSGIPKAIVMLAVLAATPLVLAAARRSMPLSPGSRRAIDIACWIALALNLVYFGARVIAPHIIDIGITTLAAGQAVLHGQNPYALPIDTGPESAGFTGYKYLPMMIVDYLPLGAPFGQRGVLITNLLMLLASLGLMKRIAGTKLAPLMLLMLPLVAEQIFAKGATDLAAVLPLLAALALTQRSSFWCGICVGLSIATKLLPGVAMLPALIPATRRDHFAAGVAVGLLPIVPFLIAGPRDFWGNIVLFNLTRLPDSTSWLHAAPAERRDRGASGLRRCHARGGRLRLAPLPACDHPRGAGRDAGHRCDPRRARRASQLSALVDALLCAGIGFGAGTQGPRRLYQRRKYRFRGYLIMAVDLELDRHRGTWLGFARLMRWTLTLVVILLIGLAAFVA